MIGLLIRSCFQKLFLVGNLKLAELRMRNIALLRSLNSLHRFLPASTMTCKNERSIANCKLNRRDNGIISVVPIPNIVKANYSSTHRKDIKLHTRREEHCCCEKHEEEAINYVRSLYDRPVMGSVLRWCNVIFTSEVSIIIIIII